MNDTAETYNKIASDYQASKLLGFRDAIEAETLERLHGKLEGMRVIDLACGEGHYTRRLREAGADDVLGVDISSEMIRMAREGESNEPIGCRYAVADVTDYMCDDPVDLVVAMYLLNYATSPEELDGFVQAAFRFLRPGGRFVGFNDNPNSDPSAHGSMARYGFERTVDGERIDGARIDYRMNTPEGEEFGFSNYYLSDAMHRTAFNRAGFTDFSWHGPFLKVSAQSDPHWSHFMNHAPMVGFSAKKPA